MRLRSLAKGDISTLVEELSMPTEATSGTSIVGFLPISTYPQNDTTLTPFTQYINVALIRRFYSDPTTSKTVVEVEPLGRSLTTIAPTYFVNETLSAFVTRVADFESATVSDM